MHDAVKSALYICLMPFCLPCLLVTYRRRSRRRTCVMISHDITLETEHSDLTRPAVRPLPSRKRALTIRQQPESSPNPATTSTTPPSHISTTTEPPAQKTLSQAQSPLFAKLPAEIRLLIYAEVLGGETLHMRARDRRITHLKCRWPRASPQDCWDLEVHHSIFHGQPLSTSTSTHAPSDSASQPQQQQRAAPSGLLALPLTCRRAYTEALPTLYTTNTFDFDHADTLANLSATLLPARWHLLTHISLLLDYPSHTIRNPLHTRPSWLRLWRLIASIQSLQTLRLSLLDRVVADGVVGAATGRRRRSWRLSRESEDRLLEPLMRVTGLRVFEVRVPWEAGEGLAEGVQTPFVVIRPEGRGRGKAGLRRRAQEVDSTGDSEGF
ncbi:hypothetical protein K490DRAFT_66997 [Saccharata proteae CBS 121410]|uniref:DUF7730 domain-containing protein n=1 Tax=Saccharata proteae CBS 121410 TaxID=1314787 RepID=A0A9P4LXH0_9PEZI|nr:hypothetical protein K490DRAFT_66997 [Saccharata proteae CBS 121410]